MLCVAIMAFLLLQVLGLLSQRTTVTEQLAYLVVGQTGVAVALPQAGIKVPGRPGPDDRSRHGGRPPRKGRRRCGRKYWPADWGRGQSGRPCGNSPSAMART